MSYESGRDRASTSSNETSTSSSSPGKSAHTDHLTAPATATSAATGSPASTLSGTAWLDGLLGFTGSHNPTGECNCAGCVAGRAMGEGKDAPEDVPVNITKSEDGGGADDSGPKTAAAAPDTASQASAPASAPGAQAPAQAAAPGTQSSASAPGQQAAAPGQQAAAPGQQAAAPGTQAAASAPAQAAQTGQPAQAAPEGTAKTPAPTITSATRKAAPGGAATTRTTVAVGEVIDFTGSAAGTWAATAGTPATGASGTAFAWTAPDAPATVTITLTVGTQSATKEITVIAPSSLSMVVSSNHALTAGTAGVCMLTSVTVGPTTVCFGNTEWLEEPGPASGTSGYFTRFPAATIFHNPNPSFLRWNDRNTGLSDHAAWHAVPSPHSVGQFQWSIPNKYRVAGTSGAGTVFTTTTQLFQMTDTAGSMTVSKAGASASRTP